MTLVKVCGLTRSADVLLAAELGAWALGFVLTESPRRIGAAETARLIAAATRRGSGAAGEERPGRAPHTVAVVTTEPAGWIAEALEESGADAVQLSAGADGPTVAQVREAAARLRRRPLVIAAADAPDAALADFVLLDARTTGAYGGTGETLDWRALAAEPGRPAEDVVLAGGLRPDNVGAAIAALHPAAVDLSSGVESAPGVKDHQRLRDFFAAVVQADEGAARRRIRG
jgi:phosphoribosylanthranilate isomerase